MTVYRVSRRGGRPGVGECQMRILRLLRGAGGFRGPIDKLAELTGFGENSVWLALAGAAGRGLVIAERHGDILACRITDSGRRMARG